MTGYRDAPPAAPVVFRVNRSLLLAVILVVVTVVLVVVGALLSDGFRFRCDRARNECAVTSWTGVAALASPRRFALTDVNRAEVAVHPKRGTVSRARALVVAGHVEVLDRAHTNFALGDIDAWVDAVNAFLRDPKQSTLDIEVSRAWPLPLAAAAAIAAWVLYAFARTTIVVDRGRGVLGIRKLAWGRGVDFPLDQVRGAELRVVKGDGGLDLTGVRLVFDGDRHVELTAYDAFDDTAKRALVEGINWALAAREGPGAGGPAG